MGSADIAVSGAIRRKDMEAMKLALEALKALVDRNGNMTVRAASHPDAGAARAAIDALNERLLRE